MQSILTQNAPDLDHQNRFYEDNRRRMNTTLVYDYSQEQPQYSDKKVMASKVTNRDFIKMPVPEIVPPVGYR